jgi:hypothetical protein
MVFGTTQFLLEKKVEVGARLVSPARLRQPLQWTVYTAFATAKKTVAPS